ncbi:MAG: hypothetical protein OJF55_000174 [Rhodanobacteraceae bacterium]|nr:MAG: hypothetical protein OJF55_000174 [Rhodanobacteraceae bacterium]
MPDLHRPSPFIDLAAVEAWDAWFRWREQADLRDFSIEDTWRRVATALASAEPDGESATWRTRFMDALASWRLLPDERLLANAGTDRAMRRGGVLHASLNAAGFVSQGSATDASMDLAALTDCAALAVRALDNAALLAGTAAPHLRIGLVGVADALALLGLHYDSDPGRAQAVSMACALAEGCLRGDIMLAMVRGARQVEPRAANACAVLRGVAPDLLRDRTRHGARHTNLTAITSQPRLALLANDVADAIDPLRGERHAHVITASYGQRTILSSGYASNLLRSREDPALGEPENVATLPCAAQIAMRVALQPWIDEPITYPLLATKDLDDSQRLEARKLAEAHGLHPPVWREPLELLPM